MPDRIAVVLVHGLFSSAKTWSRMVGLIQNDPALNSVDLVQFDYWTPIVRLNPLRRIPDYTAIADTLRTLLATKAGDYQKIVLVTHSQGGLIVQRHLARRLSQGDGAELRRIRQVIMFACPNTGAQIALALRKAALLWRQPQERALRPIDDAIHGTRQIIHRQVINATSFTASTAPIPFAVYAGAEDNIVPLPVAQDVFPDAAALPGDHLTIIKPDSPDHLSYLALRRHLLAQIEQRTPHTGPRTPAHWRTRALVEEDILFGIDEPLSRLRQWITNRDHMFMVSIFGAGGAGKTTLAYEAVRRFAELASFTRIAWVSAKPTVIGSLGQIEQEARTGYLWQDLLVDIADQLELPVDRASSRIAENFGVGLRTLPADERCLIVVDNLETITDSKYAVDFLQREAAGGAHRVLLTTRTSVLDYTDRVNQLEWNRLPEEAARQLILHLGRDDPALGLGPGETDVVVRESGGNPLIIKLIVRLCIDRRQTVVEIVHRLRAEAAGGGAGLASYLYNAAVKALHSQVGEREGAGLLNAFCGVDPGDTIDSEEFFRRSGIPDREQFDDAKAAASRLALLTASQGNARFSMHPVLTAFICGGE